MDNKKMENTNIPQEKENQDLEFNIQEVEPVIAPMGDDDFSTFEGDVEDTPKLAWSCSRKVWCC
jgi:hypothetical protein